MTNPVMVVIENPQEDPTVLQAGEIEVHEITSYPLSKWCDDDEAVSYAESGYRESLVAARDALGGSEYIDDLIARWDKRISTVKV